MPGQLYPMTFVRISKWSGKQHIRSIMVDPLDILLWRRGRLIQDALPYLSDEDKEFLISGVTPEEWSEMVSMEDSEC